MDILTFIGSAFNKVDNVAILVLLVVNGGLFWHLKAMRQETREDQKAIVEALNKNTAAMADLRVAVAVNTGRQS